MSPEEANMSVSATDIKRHIGKPSDGAMLCLADVDGESWATNRYWMTRTANLAPLLDKFNVDASSHGSYDVNGSIHKRGDDAPALGRFLNIADYTEQLTRVTTAAGDAYSRTGDGHYLALFTGADGRTVGVRADWLDWLSDAIPYKYGERYSQVAVMGKPSDRGIGCIAITAERETRHGGHYDDSHHYVPETWEPAGQVIVAVVMPCKTS